MTEYKNNFFTNIENLLCDEIIIIGDMNIDLNNGNNNKWIKECQKQGLTQIITESTRITDKSSTLLDHIYVNRTINVSNSGVLPLSLSDHLITFIGRKTKFFHKINERPAIMR